MSEASDPTAPLLKKTQPKDKPTWRLYWELSRFNQFPTGIITLFWPCVWAALLALRNNPPEVSALIRHLAPIFIACTCIHSAACVFNDICDRDLDRQVERCKNRPIASGAVSIPKATVLLLVYLVPSVFLLTLVNHTAMICGLIWVFLLHGIYPLTKRWTNWPQAYLGLAMNWGYPTTWLIVAPQDVWSPIVWIPTLGFVSWIIIADSIYAYQDREDDVKVGVKSTAILFGSYIRPILSVFAAIFVATLAYTGIKTDMSLPYFVIAVGGAALHLLWQMCTWNPEDDADSMAKWKSNGNLGYIITAGVISGVYLPDLFRL